MPRPVSTTVDLLVDFTREDLASSFGVPDTEGAYDWMEDALCAQVDPDLFFPEHQGSKTCNKAKAVCASCPVVSQCLEQALRVPAMDDFGVWGMTTPPEREQIRRDRRDGIDLTKHHAPDFAPLDLEPAEGIDLTTMIPAQDREVMSW